MTNISDVSKNHKHCILYFKFFLLYKYPICTFLKCLISIISWLQYIIWSLKIYCIVLPVYTQWITIHDMERLISYRFISHGKSAEVKVNCKYYDGCYNSHKFDFILLGIKITSKSWQPLLFLKRVRSNTNIPMIPKIMKLYIVAEMPVIYKYLE